MKMLLVDGNSILNRAFYGIRPLTTKDGLPTQAVYGMIQILLTHLSALRPDRAAVAFDLRAPTFRHRAYAAYKANRHGMPEELARQLPYAHDAVRALGFHVVEQEGYEADDLLGTMARLGAEAGDDVRILTGDRDALQLIDERVHILLAGNGDTPEFDSAAFREKYGVLPEQYVDVKALMGDSSDNIPGVHGIGEKTAFKLIAFCGSLENLYHCLHREDPDVPVTASVRQKLLDGEEDAKMSQFLARIHTAVPLGRSAESFAYGGYEMEKIRTLFTRLEFGKLLQRLEAEAGAEKEAKDGGNESGNTSLPIFREAGTETAKAVLETVAARAAKALAAGTEPLELPEDCYASLLPGESLWWVRTSDDAFTCAPSVTFLRLLGSCGCPLSVWDAKELYAAADAAGVPRIAPPVFDAMLAAYLLHPGDGERTLERAADTYLGAGPWEQPEARAEALFRLRPVCVAQLRQDGMFGIYRDMELPLTRVLADMETAGISVDCEGLRTFGEFLGQAAEHCADTIYEYAGGTFNIQSPKQLGEVLFERLGLPAPKKTKSGYSTAADALEKLRPYHPIIEAIFEYRQLTKLKSTYADGLVKAADAQQTVHTTFQQAVTATGRLSSTEPNLQNIPIRTELGKEFRRFFRARRSDYLLIDADYSQIELRLLAHISGDEAMIRAFREGQDIHTFTASQVFGVEPEAVTSEMRKRAKAVNFGIVYGIGDFSLAGDLGISRKQAAAYIRSYFDRYPGVEAYMKRSVEEAKETGMSVTLFGRRRYIPELRAGKAPLRAFGERVAMNSPIQGTAADLMKMAMLRVSDGLRAAGIDARMILQVHDELIVEAHRDCVEEASRILRDAMEGVAALSVPLTVDLTVGETWFA